MSTRSLLINTLASLIFLGLVSIGGILLFLGRLYTADDEADAILPFVYLGSNASAGNFEEDFHNDRHVVNMTTDISLKEYIDLYEQKMNARTTTEIRPNLTLWQTWSSHIFPDELEKYWQGIVSRNPEYTRKVLNDTEIYRYISLHCGGSYFDLFRSINPNLGAMKADLWRYCVLYTNGGIYMDADTGINPNTPLREWVDRNVVLSQGGNNYQQSTYRNCRAIWNAANETLPKEIMTSNSLVQWAMIYPLPFHPILKEAMDITTRLITSWNDDRKNHWSTHDRIVCLSGPAVLAVATKNAYEAAGHNWERLMVTMESGIDFEGKVLYKSPLSGLLYKKQKHYNHVGSSIHLFGGIRT